MRTFQFVLNSSKKFNQLICSSAKKYIASLLISSGRKNCTSMSYELCVSYHSIYKFLDPSEFREKSFKEYLISVVHMHATKESPGVLIVDNSQIMKLYSKIT